MFEDSRETSTKDKNTVKTSVPGFKNYRKLVQKRVQNHKKPRPGHPTSATKKKTRCKPKKWIQKIEKPEVFSLFSGRGLAGGATNKSIPYCFLQCFVKASVTTYQKQEVFSK